MIARYSRMEMSNLWKPESRFHFLLQVEKAVAETQGQMGFIPKASAQAISQKAKFSYKNILKREETTRHDVTAFVDEVAHHLGTHGTYFHYGLTSSDVLDTALSLQIKESAKILNPGFKQLKQTLKKLVTQYKKALCVGRTHGIHAEPTTFGFKMLGHLAELSRLESHFQKAVSNCAVGKLSGAVGVYSSFPPELENRVCKKLGLKPEPVSTQVVPRDRLAYMIFSLSLAGAFLERLSVELRHLQRTEVGEVTEAFTKGQTGSSAMPHKKNPVSAENLTGVSRLLRSYVSPALENISLWHERDISHSSVERVILPDAFILLDYALHRMNSLLKSLQVNTERMKANMESSQGRLYSSQALKVLVKKGLPRSKAYPLVQKISQGMKEKEHLKSLLQKNKELAKYLTPKDLEEIFSGKAVLSGLVKHLDKSLKDL